jgi:hypothetical protein
VQPPVPAIEIADHADARGVGRPDGEGDAAHTLEPTLVRAEAAVDLLMLLFGPQIQIQLPDRGREAVGILDDESLARGIMHFQAISEDRSAPLDRQLEQAGFRPLRHRARRLAIDEQKDGGGIGPIGAHDDALAGGMRAQNRVGVMVAQSQQRGEFGGIDVSECSGRWID